MVSGDFIALRLQQALDHLEAIGVIATLLLCAGTFASLQGNQPLFKPFNIAYAVLNALNLKPIGLIAPVVEQETPIRLRWEAMGWKPTVWIAVLGEQDQVFHSQLYARIHTHALDCIVLDYMDHPLE